MLPIQSFSSLLVLTQPLQTQMISSVNFFFEPITEPFRNNRCGLCGDEWGLGEAAPHAKAGQVHQHQHQHQHQKHNTILYFYVIWDDRYQNPNMSLSSCWVINYIISIIESILRLCSIYVVSFCVCLLFVCLFLNNIVVLFIFHRLGATTQKLVLSRCF